MKEKIKDNEAFKEVFNQYYLVLCNYLKSFSSDHILIEDTVQDVFLKFWNQRKEGDIKNIKSYLFTATKNKFLDQIRKHKNHEKYVEEQKMIQSQTESDLEKNQDLLLIKQRIYNSLRHLPPKTKEIFELSKLKGLTYVEIAEDLGISIKTVEAHMSKALKLIRERLK